MKNISLFAAGLVLLSAPALAEVSGNVTAISEYLFRGLARENGAALQGSLDYTREDGWYSGAWISNCRLCGGNELDLYGGWTGKLNSGISLDAGFVYYLFTEDEEITNAASIDYPEVYVGAGYRSFSGTLYYTRNYLDEASDVPGSDQRGFYLTADYTHPLREGLDLVLQIGRSWGGGVEVVLGDEYLDYSLTLTQALDDGFTLSAALIDTDLERSGFEDEPKFVVGLSKGFSF